jgi:hypothetical protein
MTASLQGEFISYNATYEHLNALGIPELSLIESTEIYETIHAVRIDQPIDDGLPDFLTNDQPDPNELPDTLHASDGQIFTVANVLTGQFDGQVLPGDFEVELQVNLPAGWSYIQLDDPSQAQHHLTRVKRDDDSSLLVPENAWTTNRILRPEGQPEVNERLLRLLDYRENAGTTTYRLTFASTPGDSNCSGFANAFDIDPFVTALLEGEAGWEALSTSNCDFMTANDVNKDGLVNAFDIDSFVSVLLSP